MSGTARCPTGTTICKPRISGGCARALALLCVPCMNIPTLKFNVLTVLPNLDAKALTPAGEQLKAAADRAANIPMGPDRARAFGETILPLLLADAVTHIGGDAQKLSQVLRQAVAGAAGLAADTEYPSRAANAVW